MFLIRFLHRWLGVILAVFIMLIALSGGILVFKDTILRASYPVLSQPVTNNQQHEYPNILAQLENQFQEPTIRFLRFPSQGMNAFHLWLNDGSQAFVNPTTGTIITRWYWYESVTSTLFRLHTRLLASEVGKIILGYIGLATLFFIISGVIIWWPRRRFLKLNDVFPKRSSRIRQHFTLGIFITPLLLLFVLTGTIKAFHRPVTHAVTALLDPIPPKYPTVIVEHKKQAVKSWLDILSAINQVLPEGEIKSWSPSQPNNAAFIFRKRMPEEWHPYGRTFILLNPYDASIVQIIDARQHQLGMKIMERVYPLHTAKIGGITFKVVSVVTAFLLLSLTALGVISFFRRRLG